MDMFSCLCISVYLYFFVMVFGYFLWYKIFMVGEDRYNLFPKVCLPRGLEKKQNNASKYKLHSLQFSRVNDGRHQKVGKRLFLSFVKFQIGV